MIQGEKYAPKYTATELEEFREELERIIKKEVFLKIQNHYYREDFYEESPVHSLLIWNKEEENIDYNKGLYKKYKKESIHENMKRIMPYTALRCCDSDAIIFKPRKYNEEVALRCGLMPFKYIGHNKEVKLVGLGVYPGYAFFMKPRLDAYQVLMSGSMSKSNVLEGNEGYFKQVVGEETTEEVKKRLEKQCKVYFYFQNNGE